MSDDETPRKGTLEGTHAGDFGRDPATGGAQESAGGDRLAAELQRLDQERAAEAEQLDLLAGSLEIGDEDTLAVAAELVARPRRERGRPPGSANRRNTQVFDYLERLGHRDPAVTLSMIQSADPVQLAATLGADTFKGRMAVLALQRSAAAELMPYKYAKRPQAIELPPDAKRPMMVIGEMSVINQHNEFMSVGDPRSKKANEINADAVRISNNDPHDDSQTVENTDENGSQTSD